MPVVIDGTTGITTPSVTNSGASTLSAGTANGVAYLNGSKVLTTGSALTYDGTNLGVGGAGGGAATVNLQVRNASSAALRVTGGSGTGFDVLQAIDSVAYLWNRDNQPISFGTNNTERMRLDASGNLGLGVTPSAWGGNYKVVQYYGGAIAGYNNTTMELYCNSYDSSAGAWKRINAGYATRYATSDGSHYWTTAGNSTAGSAITWTQVMTLDASGNLLVGTTSGTKHVFLKNNSNNEAVQIENSASSNPYGSIIYFSAVAPNDATRYFLNCQDNAASRAIIRSNGGIANYQANNVNLSDRREKTNFAPAGEYLSKICAIPVQTFNYIDQSEDDPGLTLGVVAQDVQAVAPELVMESNWGTEEEPKMRLSIYQTDLQYALMKCIQEQQALIEQLTTRIAALEAK